MCEFIRAIRQCTKIFLLHFFHGQTGALSTLNNIPAAFHISGVYFLYSSVLTIPVHKEASDKWWLGRLHFVSDTFSRYGDYYFPQEDKPVHDYYNGRRPRYTEPEIPVSIEDTLSVLTLVWSFVSAATSIQNSRVINTAVQIFCNTLLLVGKYPRGLERAREFLRLCHRSVVDEINEAIEGYETRLDKMLEDNPHLVEMVMGDHKLFNPKGTRYAKHYFYDEDYQLYGVCTYSLV